MIIQNNINLSKKTTFHIGGTAKNFYIPENSEELISLLKDLKDSEYKIISGGSNILINDEKVFENVISMEKVDLSFTYKGDGVFYIGSSNRIQSIIHKINSYGYGGFEELISLPAMLGGIIYMNAGIGSVQKCVVEISSFIEKVKVINLDKLEIEYLDNSECNFAYRSSLFHNNKYIILGAIIKTYKQDINVSKKRIDDRLKYSKSHHEWGKGCFGTCFSKCDRKILKLLSILSINKKGVYQSKNNSNWLVNDGTGTYKKAMRLINKCIRFHKLFGKTIRCEVQIWE